MNPARGRPRPQRRPKQRSKGKCTASGKARFTSFETAVAAALRVSRILGPLRCYECPLCGGWHFTRSRVWKGQP